MLAHDLHVYLFRPTDIEVTPGPNLPDADFALWRTARMIRPKLVGSKGHGQQERDLEPGANEKRLMNDGVASHRGTILTCGLKNQKSSMSTSHWSLSLALISVLPVAVLETSCRGINSEQVTSYSEVLSPCKSNLILVLVSCLICRSTYGSKVIRILRILFFFILLSFLPVGTARFGRMTSYFLCRGGPAFRLPMAYRHNASLPLATVNIPLALPLLLAIKTT
jgi:hypothetical protein